MHCACNFVDWLRHMFTGLQGRIQQLKLQLASLVESFEKHSDNFCSAFDRSHLEQQEATIQEQEQESEANLAAAQQQLQAKCKQLAAQQAAVKQLRQQMADSKASIQGEGHGLLTDVCFATSFLEQ